MGQPPMIPPTNSAKCINTLDHQLLLTFTILTLILPLHVFVSTTEEDWRVRKTCSVSAFDHQPFTKITDKTSCNKGHDRIKEKGSKQIALVSHKGRKTMSEWLRFLCSYCLHIIQTCILNRFVWTDLRLFLLCWLYNEFFCVCSMLSIYREAYLRT